MHLREARLHEGPERTLVDREERLGEQLDPGGELVAVAERAERGAERGPVAGVPGADGRVRVR